jgi:G:T/U-mismatch repair DNA glycosylase
MELNGAFGLINQNRVVELWADIKQNSGRKFIKRDKSNFGMINLILKITPARITAPASNQQTTGRLKQRIIWSKFKHVQSNSMAQEFSKRQTLISRLF